MSYTEDNGLDEYSMIDEMHDIEILWQKGIHKDQHNNEWKLSEMSTQHLINIIECFKMFDTEPLKEELKKRNEKSNPKM